MKLFIWQYGDSTGGGGQVVCTESLVDAFAMLKKNHEDYIREVIIRDPKSRQWFESEEGIKWIERNKFNPQEPTQILDMPCIVEIEGGYSR